MAFRAMTNSAALAIGVHLHMVETDAPASFPIIIDPGTLFSIGFHPFTSRELAAQVVRVVAQNVGFSVDGRLVVGDVTVGSWAGPRPYRAIFGWRPFF